jgi:hypothetical protein
VAQTATQPSESAKQTFYAMTEFASWKDRICFATQTKIACKRSITRRTVIRHQQELEVCGWIVRREDRTLPMTGKRARGRSLLWSFGPLIRRRPKRMSHIRTTCRKALTTTARPKPRSVQRSEVLNGSDTRRTYRRASRGERGRRRKLLEHQRQTALVIRSDGAETPFNAGDAVAVVCDAARLNNVIIPLPLRAIIGRRAKELIASGFEAADVVEALVVSIRRGRPEIAHYIALDIQNAKAGWGLSRDQYRRQLEDYVELASSQFKRLEGSKP